MGWKRWKSAEKQVAEFFGGVRHVRLSYSEFSGDITHDSLAIEVKYGKQIPAVIHDDHPFILNGEYLVTHCDILVDALVTITSCKDELFSGVGMIQKVTCKRITFIANAFAQACNYFESTNKIPLVCCKRNNQSGFTVILHVFDALKLLEVIREQGRVNRDNKGT